MKPVRTSCIPGALASTAAVVVLVVLALQLPGCGRKPAASDAASYRDEIQKWQQHRVNGLMRDDSWLTLCGLFWLKEGENTIGSDSTSAVILPAGKSKKIAGSLFLDEGTVRLKALPGSGMTINDSAVATAVLQSDADGATAPTTVRMGSLSFFIIKRGDRLGVRVKDKDNPARVNFKGLEFFPIDPKWRVEARFEPYVPPKMIPVETVINTTENDSCPGALVFTLEGVSCRLDATIETGSENQLFIMFSDETSGRETYGPGRQMYTTLPDSTGHVVLDFNKAYNWPCVYTEFATCPIPPRQNHLPVRVEAGEKMYAGFPGTHGR